jgi:hypothetical protein
MTPVIIIIDFSLEESEDIIDIHIFVALEETLGIMITNVSLVWKHSIPW